MTKTLNIDESSSLGGRKFYDWKKQEEGSRVFSNLEDEVDSEELSVYVRSQVIGNDAVFVGPYGPRKIVYCDFTASGRSLKFIENYVLNEVLPYYGNTHTTTSVTSLQSTLYRHEARDIVRNACNASEQDAVIFAGSGSTGAVRKLISVLGWNSNDFQRPIVVFVSIQEHHSNLLPWRLLPSCTVVTVGETSGGQLDVEILERELVEAEKNFDDPLLVGCFLSASNITGILNDDLTITALMHQHGGFAFWDYSTAAPYVHVDMNPRVEGDSEGLCRKDAIYFSFHKFVGGVQTPGVLIAKKKLFRNPVPEGGGGGGSVFFVTKEDQRFLRDPEVREEGGTPAIVESIRAGMVMQLKQAVGADFILKREAEVLKKAKRRLSGVDNLLVLGTTLNAGNHLPILAFVISAPEPMKGYLHHNFVCSMLNDVFGIQARGGCACSGPYAQHLLGMSHEMSKEYESMLMEDERLDRIHLRRGHAEYSQYEILRPGFSRLNLPWFFSDEEIDFVLDALVFVAENGWKLMPQYIFNNETGEWHHHTHQVFKDRKWVGHISYAKGIFENRRQGSCPEVGDHITLDCVRLRAEELVTNAVKAAMKLVVPDQRILFHGRTADLRWMVLPIECKELLLKKSPTSVMEVPPFVPKRFEDPGPDVAKSAGSLHAKGNHQIYRRYLVRKRRLELDRKLSRKEPLDPTETTCKTESCFRPQKNQRAVEAIHPPLVSKAICRWQPPTKDIFKPFLEAVEEFDMIGDGDRVLVCLSGGKDSLSLLHTMRQYQFYAKKTKEIRFELAAITVDPQSSAFDPRPLIPYLAELGVPYLYEEQAIMKQALDANCSSICAFCSRMKRGRIYAAARRDGYNVLAMGQHLDDLAESFLMSVFHNGRLRTLKANYAVKEGDLRIVRPLVYVRERNLRQFAEGKKLPVIAENCPGCFENPKERHRVKQLLAQQELLFPRLYWSLKSAMHPAMNVRKTGIESFLFGKNGNRLLPPSTADGDTSSDES